MVAVDKATEENGCLQVISGSHKMGRVDHSLTGDQAGANEKAVTESLNVLTHTYVHLNPGDALFSHSNLLHHSNQNKSENPRWALFSCYDTKSNSPYKKSHHPEYTLLKKVKDEDVLKGLENGITNLNWLNHAEDHSADVLQEA